MTKQARDLIFFYNKGITKHQVAEVTSTLLLASNSINETNGPLLISWLTKGTFEGEACQGSGAFQFLKCIATFIFTQGPGSAHSGHQQPTCMGMGNNGRF